MTVLVSIQRLRTLVFLLVFTAAGVGCGFINDIDGPAGLAIKKFTLSPKEVTAGGASTLSWEVEGADQVQIDNGIGIVKAKGSLEVKVSRTTTYSITARAAGSTATASVQLVVGSPSGGNPSPGATPTPSPSTTPTPSPTPSASPTPRPSPGSASACGESVDSVQGCTVTIQRIQTLPANECLEITRIAFSQGCPLGVGTSRAISFDVMAETQLRDLRWRKQAGGRDGLDPEDGRLIRHGSTTSIAKHTVQEGSLTIEIISEGKTILTFRLRNN